MRIVLFGGAFDPPHLGHQQIATSLLQHNLADEVWYVPVKQHYFGKQMTTPEQRLKMLELIQQPGTRIETYEFHQEGVNYTFNTLDALSAHYPEHQFTWIIGSDNLAKFHLWGDKYGRPYTELLRAYPFLVYPRHDFPFEPLYAGMTALPQLPEINVSSTQVREMVKTDQDIGAVVTPAVAEYIQTQGLYRSADSS